LISGIWFHPLCLFLIGGYFYLVWDFQFSSYMPCTTNFPFQEHNILKVEANCVSLVMPNYMKSEFLSLGILSAPSIFNFISLFFFFWDRVLLYGHSWPGTYCVAQAGLQLVTFLSVRFTGWNHHVHLTPLFYVTFIQIFSLLYKRTECWCLMLLVNVVIWYSVFNLLWTDRREGTNDRLRETCNGLLMGHGEWGPCMETLCAMDGRHSNTAWIRHDNNCRYQFQCLKYNNNKTISWKCVIEKNEKYWEMSWGWELFEISQ
jgi:hypothetical protein